MASPVAAVASENRPPLPRQNRGGPSPHSRISGDPSASVSQATTPGPPGPPGAGSASVGAPREAVNPARAVASENASVAGGAFSPGGAARTGGAGGATTAGFR